MAESGDLALARAFIEQGRWDDARFVLQTSGDPIAAQWLEKLNQSHPALPPIYAPGTPTPKSRQANASQKDYAITVVFSMLLVIGGILVGLVGIALGIQPNNPSGALTTILLVIGIVSAMWFMAATLMILVDIAAALRRNR